MLAYFWVELWISLIETSFKQGFPHVIWEIG